MSAQFSFQFSSNLPRTRFCSLRTPLDHCGDNFVDARMDDSTGVAAAWVEAFSQHLQMGMS